MKSYWALRFIASLLTIFGWVTIVFDVLALLLFIFGGSQPGIDATVANMIAVSIFSFFIISGVMLVAAGELIKAFIDIAKNCTNLPLIQENTYRMVEFFELMANRQRAPSA